MNFCSNKIYCGVKSKGRVDFSSLGVRIDLEKSLRCCISVLQFSIEGNVTLLFGSQVCLLLQLQTSAKDFDPRIHNSKYILYPIHLLILVYILGTVLKTIHGSLKMQHLFVKRSRDQLILRVSRYSHLVYFSGILLNAQWVQCVLGRMAL